MESAWLSKVNWEATGALAPGYEAVSHPVYCRFLGLVTLKPGYGVAFPQQSTQRYLIRTLAGKAFYRKGLRHWRRSCSDASQGMVPRLQIPQPRQVFVAGADCMARVLEVNDIEELRAFHPFWKSLLAKTPRATFFQTLEWLEIYWRHYGQGKKLRVLLIQVEGQILGIVPLVQQVENTKAGPVSVLTFPLDCWGSFFGPLGSDTAATLYAAAQYLAAGRRDWDLLDLRWIDPEVDRGRTVSAMRCHGLSPNDLPWHSAYAVELIGSFGDYLATRSSHFRERLRQARRLAAAEGVFGDRYRPAEGTFNSEQADLTHYENCVEVAARSWQGSSTTGTTLSHPESAAYFRDCFLAASNLGMLDLVSLRRKEEVVAFCYNFHHGGRIQGIRMGYEPGFQRLSLGTVLMAFQIEDSFQRGDSMIDLGTQHAEVKQRWVTRALPARRVCYYSPLSMSAHVLRWGHWWKYPKQPVS